MPEQRSATETAVLRLSEGRYTDAGEMYATAARGCLYGESVSRKTAYESRGRSGVGRAFAQFARSSVCHRISGDEDRATLVAREGVAVAKELRDHVLTDVVEGSACDEFIGDMRASAGLSPDGAYDSADEGYAEVSDGASETGRPFLQAGTELLSHLSRPDDMGWDDIHGSGGDALGRRIRTKKARMAALADERVREGKLHAPRGSTEYNTDRYVCPDCGSTDVNHVGGTKLCLRCSSQTEEV
ncbi:hypothetical protein EGH25_01970 [Haladaptatus sp. F3-133]|jgi:hypothetical protein|uniref:Uncharacterized protein n=1 Tax=Halorutilus salinus TaxID=2487751 RepID=A0A9Q4GFZ4_9EURY|nr:hypothetical protein [Halorutilus salinus]MCX2818122.1 hypothetical protein [Halorutilus salinus]